MSTILLLQVFSLNKMTNPILGFLFSGEPVFFGFTQAFWQNWQLWPYLFAGLAVLLTLGFHSRTHSLQEENLSLQELLEKQQSLQAELAESEARLRATFENASFGISVISPEGKILSVNSVMVELSGYSAEELIELGGQNLVHPDDREIGLREFRDVLAGERDTYQIERRYVKKDGKIKWMRQNISAVRDSSGKLLFVISLAEDIDNRKRMIEELRESEARFKALFDSAAVGMAVMSLDRQVIQINQTTSRITGYSMEELSNIEPVLLAIEEDRYLDKDLYQELSSGLRDQYTIEKRYIKKDGSTFWGRVNFSAVQDANHKPIYIVGMIEDITEEKLASERLAAKEAEYRALLEQKLSERTEELNQANEKLREKVALDAVAAERSRLARDLHDAVTQTLFSTTLIADVLPELWEVNPDDGKQRLEELRKLTRGALAEMRTLLVELRPNALLEIPLPTLLRQLTEAMVGRSEVNIQFSCEGSCNLPAEIQVGFYRIAQEALNNVVKHAKASESIVTLRCADITRMTITDNGVGFDPSTVTADHLGLKIMRERTDAIGGRLGIYSEKGEGTQVSVVWDQIDPVGQ